MPKPWEPGGSDLDLRAAHEADEPLDLQEAMLRVYGMSPSLEDRVVALFNNDLSVVHTAVVIQNRLGLNTPMATSSLDRALLSLVRVGRLYYLHNRESEGYRLVRREGVEALSALDRLLEDEDK